MNKLLQYDFVNQMLGQLPTIKRLFFSVVAVALFAFLFVSLFSYDPTDPAWSYVGAHQDITNIGGRLGAWTADILLVFFGFGAWFILLVIVYELVHLWWERTSVFWLLRFFAYVFLLACVSALCAQIGTWWGNKSTIFGGVLGHELMASLVGVLGVMATIGFLGVVGLVVAVLTFDIPWLAFWQKRYRKAGVDEVDTKDMMSDESGYHDKFIISQNSPIVPNYQPHNHEGTLESFLVNSGLREELIAKKQAELDSKLAEDHTGSMPIYETHTQPNYEDLPNDVVGEMSVVDANAPHQADEPTAFDDFIEQPVVLSDINDSDVSHEVGFDEVILPDLQETNLQEMSLPKTKVDLKGLDLGDLAVNNDVGSFELPNAPQFDAFQPDDFQMAESTKVEQAPVHNIMPKSMPSGVERPKSYAMSTLEYRMSLSPVPTLDILDPKPKKFITYTPSQLQELSELLEIKLQEFNIKASVISAMVGPVVTRFEVDLAAGIKASRVSKISQDLARSMRMTSLRVIPVIAGKSYIGIEVPNRNRQEVGLIELLDTDDYKNPNAGISIAIGADINGKPVIADLAKAPHMLVAGTTGSGKSVLVNSFLMSMLLKYTPDELKLMLIDPKQLELANYVDIPHLLTPVITDMAEATAALNWCVTEMERRYLLMSKLRVRNLAAFNQKIAEANEAGEPILDPLWHASDHVSDGAPKLKPLSKIVVVADEFADMIMQLGKTAEEPIVRLAQKSRAAGIHLILATQRPVANVVTGLIKSNIPSRVALRVNSATDSRIIIEESGAENMLGHGDMMFLAPGAIETERVHGAYVKDDEVNRVTDAWRERGVPDYIDLSESYTFEGEGSGDGGAGGDDEYFDLAVSHILETRKVSISALQRKFSIGYNRAARIVDVMEERGVVSAADHSGKRQILM